MTTSPILEFYHRRHGVHDRADVIAAAVIQIFAKAIRAWLHGARLDLATVRREIAVYLRNTAEPCQQLDLFKVQLPPCDRLGCPRYGIPAGDHIRCPMCGSSGPLPQQRCV